jgi:hypothetical protein
MEQFYNQTLFAMVKLAEDLQNFSYEYFWVILTAVLFCFAIKKGVFMLKKILSFFLIGFLIAGPAFARTVSETLISSTTLDADPTSASGSMRLRNVDQVAFFVTYDETQVGGISAAVTVDISWDGTTWLDASFYDFAGGATLQTSESLTADGNYYFWLGSENIAPYVRVVIAATGSDADDTAVVTATIVKREW